MKGSIAKWGNSLALRLPRGLAEDAKLVEGTLVELRLEGDRIVVTPAVPKYELDDLLAKMRPEHKHGETDWGAPVGKEEW
jgi:antitoxin MazE